MDAEGLAVGAAPSSRERESPASGAARAAGDPIELAGEWAVKQAASTQKSAKKDKARPPRAQCKELGAIQGHDPASRDGLPVIVCETEKTTDGVRDHSCRSLQTSGSRKRSASTLRHRLGCVVQASRKISLARGVDPAICRGTPRSGRDPARGGQRFAAGAAPAPQKSSSFSGLRDPVLKPARMRKVGTHLERHQSGRAAWLRAAVLGSDDAIVSTASLMVGVAASAASKAAVLVAGVAGLVAGSMSMAVGEYISVSSQRDAQQADIDREQRELAADPQAELNELAMIYARRGLDRDLAMKVAIELSAHDRLAAHMRDELGIEPGSLSRPLQAAWISAVSFASFATVPLVALIVTPNLFRVPAIAGLSLASLAALGALGGHLGGAPMGRAAFRVIVGGGLAMAATAAIGRILGIAMG
jgi:vacuolar iron transporter family protein